MRRLLSVVLVAAAICCIALFTWAFAPSSRQEIRHETLKPSELVGVRFDPRPQTKIEPSIIGYTVRKTPIEAFVFGNGKKHVIVLGAVHGDEPSSASVTRIVVDLFAKNQPAPEISVIVVPVVNPDGLESQKRTNHNGVDINRNFPAKTWRPSSSRTRYFPGEKPLSELETQIIVELIKKWPPLLIISVHAPLHCVNWDGPAETVAGLMAEACGYPMCEDIGYPTPGSLGAYAGKDLNIPVITLELREAHGSEDVISEGVRALEAAIKWVSR